MMPGLQVYETDVEDYRRLVGGSKWTVSALGHSERFDPRTPTRLERHLLTVNGRVWLWDDCYIFGGHRFQSGMYSCSDFNNDFDKMDWYNVFHVGATYEPTFVEWLEGLKFSVVVDNLFDEEYCDYATYGTQYYPAAGRSFTFTVRYEF